MNFEKISFGGAAVEDVKTDKKEEEQKFDYDEFLKRQVIEKLWTSWRVARDYAARGSEKYGKVVNQDMTGRIFYDSLFSSDSVGKNINHELSGRDVTDKSEIKIRDDDKGTLGESLIRRTENKPDREQFVAEYRHAMTNEVDFQKAYFDGAKEEVKKMLSTGPVRIWTTGDVAGVPSLGLHGSYEQLKRLAKGGWNDLRRMEVAEKIASGESTTPGEAKRNLDFDVVAHEDKMEQLKHVMKDYLEKGVEQLVIVDDKIPNLLQAEKNIVSLFPEFSGKVALVWDRQSDNGAPAKDKNSKLPDGYVGTAEDAIKDFNLVSVDDIRNITEKAMERIGKSDAKVGWIVDHDDVISEDNKRAGLQEEAIIKMLKSKHYIE